MIKRITNPDEFCLMVDDLRDIIPKEDSYEAHALGMSHDTESIKLNYSNKQLLAWDLFIWANKTGEKYDACIAFFNDKNVKFGVDMFSEYVWVSKNPKIGFKLFKEAIKFARESGFKIITLSVLEDNPNSEKIENSYKKLGFLKDSTTYVAKL